MPRSSLVICQIKICQIFLFTLVSANPPNLISAKFSGYMDVPLPPSFTFPTKGHRSNCASSQSTCKCRLKQKLNNTVSKKSLHTSMKNSYQNQNHPASMEGAKKSLHTSTENSYQNQNHPASMEGAKKSLHTSTENSYQKQNHPASMEGAKKSLHPCHHKTVTRTTLPQWKVQRRAFIHVNEKWLQEVSISQWQA